jgi:hypothetical protein
MLRLLPGTICIALTFLVLGAAFMGVGLGLRRAFGLIDLDANDCFTAFWMGFATVLLFLIYWNFVFPVTGVTLAIVLGVGAVGLFVVRDELRDVYARREDELPRASLWIVGLVLFWLSNLSIDFMSNWDSALYHMQGVEWAHRYPAVKGLANLFGPLGFNNASFLYDALVDSGPWRGRGWHVANGLLVFMLAAQSIVAGVRFLRNTGWKASSDLFTFILLAPAIGMGTGESLANYSTDIPRTTIRLATAALWYRWLVRPPRELNAEAYDLVRIVMLCAAAVAIKLSAAVSSLAIIVTATIVWIVRRHPGRSFLRRTIAWPLALGLLFGIGWTARGIVLSGYPMFPSPVFATSVDWRVPAEHAQAEYDQIRNSSRGTFDNLDYVSGRDTSLHSWLPHWFTLLWADAYYVLVPGILIVVLLPLLLFRGAWSRIDVRRMTQSGWWLLVPSTLSIIVWFTISPEPRYAVGPFWSLAALIFAQTAARLGGLAESSRKWPTFIVAFILGVSPVVVNPTLHWIRGSSTDTSLFKEIVHNNVKVPFKGDWLLPVRGQPAVHPFVTTSGLVINVPESKCYGAEIPCTPNPAPNLRLRVAGDITQGFMVDGTWQMQHWPEPWRPTLLPAIRESWRRKHE